MLVEEVDLVAGMLQTLVEQAEVEAVVGLMFNDYSKPLALAQQ